MTDLFSPTRLGELALANRLVMAPLTRNRAAATVPGPLNAEYYRQRATAGLVITEGTQPSAVGQGYPDTPGLHSQEQVAGWRLVADAVHTEGGTVVAQLMHSGRIGHVSITGIQPVAPSAVAAQGEVFTPEGMKPFEAPRALATDELPGVVEEFVAAARNARAAGLDGVELHAANGYLLHQFLSDSTNTRTDAYGGSPEARARLVVEVATAVAAAIGAGRVGIRISPGNPVNDMAETEVQATYAALVEGLEPLGLAYLHVLEAPEGEHRERILKRWTGPVIVNTGFTAPSDLDAARTALALGADAFAIGRGFLANPDLVERLRTGAELNEPDPDTFYGGGEKGYTDYPTLTR